MKIVNKMFKHIIACLFCSFVVIPIMAQNYSGHVNTVFWGNIDEFLNNQAEQTLDLINQTIEEYPPVKGELLARKLALYNLDGILHETRYDKSQVLRRFMATRIKSVLKKMSTPIANNEMEVIKLYNHGFIIRTQSVTCAFDLYRGDSLISDSLMQSLVHFCDILFVSHIHSDHADPQVAKMFVKEGKPVWGPTNLWPEDSDVYHIRMDKIIERTVCINKKKLIVKILPGHQDDLMNNIYNVITPEGFSVVHTGDQYNKGDLMWIANIKQQIPSLDILLVNCWTMQLEKVVEDFDPKLVITGHENELGHTIDHREPYWLSYQKLSRINKPYVLMTWGEVYEYRRIQ